MRIYEVFSRCRGRSIWCFCRSIFAYFRIPRIHCTALLRWCQMSVSITDVFIVYSSRRREVDYSNRSQIEVVSYLSPQLQRLRIVTMCYAERKYKMQIVLWTKPTFLPLSETYFCFSVRLEMSSCWPARLCFAPFESRSQHPQHNP